MTVWKKGISVSPLNVLYLVGLSQIGCYLLLGAGLYCNLPILASIGLGGTVLWAVATSLLGSITLGGLLRCA